jgi:hypothetical protein
LGVARSKCRGDNASDDKPDPKASDGVRPEGVQLTEGETFGPHTLKNTSENKELLKKVVEEKFPQACKTRLSLSR